MKISLSQDSKRSITYSLDACYTGFYLWLGNFTLRLGGINVNESGSPYFYPYLVPTFAGFGFALPNYFSWHTPFGKFKKISNPSQPTRDNHSQELKDIAA